MLIDGLCITPSGVMRHRISTSISSTC